MQTRLARTIGRTTAALAVAATAAVVPAGIASAAPAGVAPGAQAAPAAVAPEPTDETPLVVQARDYPIGIAVTTGENGGFQRVVAPGEHFVLDTRSGASSTITFTFGGSTPDQVYEIDPDHVMRFDAQGSEQYPSVTLRMS